MAELYPQAVLGYRQWKVADNELHSLVSSHKAWLPGANTAVCSKHVDHPPPAPYCHCGMYAWHEPKWPHENPSSLVLNGAVAGRGAIRLHADGWRAESAQILALYLAREQSDSLSDALDFQEDLLLASKVANKYGVKLFLDQQQMIEYVSGYATSAPEAARQPDLVSDKEAHHLLCHSDDPVAVAARQLLQQQGFDQQGIEQFQFGVNCDTRMLQAPFAPWDQNGFALGRMMLPVFTSATCKVCTQEVSQEQLNYYRQQTKKAISEKAYPGGQLVEDYYRCPACHADSNAASIGWVVHHKGEFFTNQYTIGRQSFIYQLERVRQHLRNNSILYVTESVPAVWALWRTGLQAALGCMSSYRLSEQLGTIIELAEEYNVSVCYVHNQDDPAEKIIQYLNANSDDWQIQSLEELTGNRFLEHKGLIAGVEFG